MGLKKQSSCSFQKKLMFPLHHTILLWSVWTRSLVEDAMIKEEPSIKGVGTSKALSLLMNLTKMSN